jgi:hypothetical protein
MTGNFLPLIYESKIFFPNFFYLSNWCRALNIAVNR